MPFVRLAIVGELNPSFPPHRAVDASLAEASAALSIDLDARWVGTDVIEADGVEVLADAHAIWISPGSPYRSLDGALAAIRYGREHGVPTLGTCGGFQHLVLEYARNVMGIADAQHAEIDATASRLVLTALTCSRASACRPVSTSMRSARDAPQRRRSRRAARRRCPRRCARTRARDAEIHRTFRA